MHHVFVDFENTQPDLPGSLNPEGACFHIFFGATLRSRTLIGKESAYLRQFGPRSTTIRIAAPGPSALDFHIAFYVGRVTASDPRASISIISNDKGFDPLVLHLRQSGVPATRAPSLESLPVVLLVQSLSTPERVQWVLPQLTPAMGGNEKKLTRSLHRLFRRCLSEAEIETVRRSVVSLRPSLQELPD